MRMRLLFGAALVAAAAAAPAAAQSAPACRTDAASQHFVEQQGMRIAYVRCGESGPAFVFEMGFGGNLEAWEELLPRIAAFAPVFAYSRPNRGRSEGVWAADGDGMRTSEESARLLHDVLAAAGVRPPYILVGVSLGGLYIQKFAQLFPRDTAGLVLLDNRPASYIGECRAAGVPQCSDDPPDPFWSASIRSTFLGIAPSEAVAPTPEQLGNIPVLVITATRTEMENADAFFTGFRDAQTRFTARLRHGRQYLATGASHDSLIRAQADQVATQLLRFRGEVAQRRRRR